MKAAVENAETYIVLPITGNSASPFVHIKNIVRQILAKITLIMTDLLGVLLAMLFAFQFRLKVLPVILPIFPNESPPHMTDNIWWLWGIALLCFAYERLYTRRLSFWRETKRLITATTLAFILIFAGISLAKLGSEVSRTVLVTAYLICLILLPLNRYLMKLLLTKMGCWQEYILILGADSTARQIAASLDQDWYQGYQVYGFLGKEFKPGETVKIQKHSIPIYGNFEDAARILESTDIQQLIIAAPELSGTQLVSLTHQLQPYTRSILVVPDLCGIPVVGGETEYFFDDQIIAFRTHNNLSSKANIIAKRVFDLSVGGILFLLAIPIMIVLAMMIRIDSPGPAIYAGKRIGRKGKVFRCYKFRTMCMDNDEILEKFLDENPDARVEWQTFAKLRGDDPRLTRVGKALRKLSLDELPQMINVIIGDMSLVGARPYLLREKGQMQQYADTILLAHPGITGLWQVSGRNEVNFEARMQLEEWYVRNWSLWLDISLLFRTIPVVFGKKGAY